MLKKNSDICLHLEDEIASWGNKFGVIKMTGILSNFPKLLDICYITDENIKNKIKINQN